MKIITESSSYFKDMVINGKLTEEQMNLVIAKVVPITVEGKFFVKEDTPIKYKEKYLQTGKVPLKYCKKETKFFKFKTNRSGIVFKKGLMQCVKDDFRDGIPVSAYMIELEELSAVDLLNYKKDIDSWVSKHSNL